jgi:DNA-binding transcriptional ArsR family regulator
MKKEEYTCAAIRTCHYLIASISHLSSALSILREAGLIHTQIYQNLFLHERAAWRLYEEIKKETELLDDPERE